MAGELLDRRAMRTFECVCGAALFFNNDQCLSCGRSIGFDAGTVDLIALDPVDDAPAEAAVWRDSSSDRRFRRCDNWALSGCPWLVAPDAPGQRCRACQINRVIPPLDDDVARDQWTKVESAKRRWIYGLIQLGLPLESKAEDPERGLALDVKIPLPNEPVMTGHDDGVITLSLSEADPVVREAAKQDFREHYRTLLGHLRHESGHYYWQRLIEHSDRLPAFRDLFGDERADYQEALERHYAEPHRTGWENRHVSAYASAHPWEDWAETWAHYLHLIDTCETAAYFKMLPAHTDRVSAFDDLLDVWSGLVVGLNAINRSLGLPDPYPFVMNDVVRRKLAFVDDVVQSWRNEG